jgi:hypothetical protein
MEKPYDIDKFMPGKVSEGKPSSEPDPVTDATGDSELLFALVEKPQEQPTERADLKTRFREVPAWTLPTERAELKISTVDVEGTVNVPGKSTGHLLDGCVAVACTISTGITTKEILETTAGILPAWAVVTVVVVQVIGIGALAWRSMRKKKR